MCRLLKLSNMAINVKHISLIHLLNDKYHIHINYINVKGLVLGNIYSNAVIEIDKNNGPDYFKVSEYILRNTI